MAILLVPGLVEVKLLVVEVQLLPAMRARESGPIWPKKETDGQKRKRAHTHE
jgi:hypothetical protein